MEVEEEILVYVIFLAFKQCRKNGYIFRIVELIFFLWDVTDELKKENDKLRLVNHQLKAWCESEKVPLAVLMEAVISCSQRLAYAEDQAQYARVSPTELQRMMNS